MALLAISARVDMTTGVSAAASDPTGALGSISANEWNDYMQHFVPYENQLINYATSNAVPQQAMTTAMGLQQGANAQGAGIAQRSMAQFDTSLNPEEAAAQQKSTGINNALSEVNAGNQAKDQAVANQESILGAPLTGITGAQ
jgi:hypothetical protein